MFLTQISFQRFISLLTWILCSSLLVILSFKTSVFHSTCIMHFARVIFKDTGKIPQVFFTSGIILPKQLLNVKKKKKEPKMTYHVSYGAGDVLYCYNMSNAKMTCPSQDEGQKHLFLCEEGCISLKTSSKKKMFSFKKK